MTRPFSLAYLHRFRERYAGPDAPPATSRALYAEVKAVTPDSLRPLLSDLFEHITLWDVRTDYVRAEPDGAGAWRVECAPASRRSRSQCRTALRTRGSILTASSSSASATITSRRSGATLGSVHEAPPGDVTPPPLRPSRPEERRGSARCGEASRDPAAHT